jgi:tetratricopeptide (TPR) repeat protein
LSEAGRFMMFWMAYGSASGGLVRQRVSLHAWVAIRPPPNLAPTRRPLFLNNAEAHYNLGVLLKERGRFEEAERAFQEAIRLNPQDALGSIAWLVCSRSRGGLRN